MPNPENLKEPWKEGDPSPNPSGRPKGSLNSATVIRRWLEAKEKSKNPVTGQDEELTQMDIIALKQLEKARKGDTRAFDALIDRTEGRPKQTFEGSLMPSKKTVDDLFPPLDEEEDKPEP